MTTHSTETPTTPCQRERWRWDLDEGTYPDWIDAQAECTTCPFLQSCRTQLIRLYPRAGDDGQGPLGVIWAGDAYSNQGTVLTNAQLQSFALHRTITAADTDAPAGHRNRPVWGRSRGCRA